MSTFRFLPEGWEDKNTIEEGKIFQGLVKYCDKDYNLHVKLDDGINGIIPRNEIEEINANGKGEAYTNLCVGKVHKYVQFKKISEDSENIILSRKQVQQDVLKYIKNDLEVGDKVRGIVKNITPYGAFIDIGGGVVGLAHIEDLSIARIKTPFERLKIGQKINIVVKSIDRENGKVNLSYKEILGTWKENVDKFSVGMKTKGIIRETEKNKNRNIYRTCTKFGRNG